MISPLPVRLRSSSTQLKEDRWSWVAWIDGPESALDAIKSVRYTLHPTFPDPVRVVTNRASKFALKSSGWGEFTLFAEVTPREGERFGLEHWLTLAYGDERTEERPPKVFVSYSATDRSLFRALKKELAIQRIDVISAEDAIKAGASWPHECGTVIAGSDIVVMLMSGELRGFAEVELEQAMKHKKTIIPLLVGAMDPPEPLDETDIVRVDPLATSDKAWDQLAARVKNAFYSRMKDAFYSGEQ